MQVSFGVQFRSFQGTWLDKWPWLHWDNTSECVFCHVCVRTVQASKLKAKSAIQTFLSRGFQNWKNATQQFRSHEQSACHIEAVEKVITLPAITKHVGVPGISF